MLTTERNHYRGRLRVYIQTTHHLWVSFFGDEVRPCSDFAFCATLRGPEHRKATGGARINFFFVVRSANTNLWNEAKEQWWNTNARPSACNSRNGPPTCRLKVPSFGWTFLIILTRFRGIYQSLMRGAFLQTLLRKEMPPVVDAVFTMESRNLREVHSGMHAGSQQFSWKLVWLIPFRYSACCRL